MLTRSDMIAAFGDDQTALMMCDPHTTLVENAPTAEWFKVEDGKIVQSRLVFDRTPFDAARQAARPSQPVCLSEPISA
jgi:hypothetical protein